MRLTRFWWRQEHLLPRTWMQGQASMVARLPPPLLLHQSPSTGTASRCAKSARVPLCFQQLCLSSIHWCARKEASAVSESEMGFTHACGCCWT